MLMFYIHNHEMLFCVLWFQSVCTEKGAATGELFLDHLMVAGVSVGVRLENPGFQLKTITTAGTPCFKFKALTGLKEKTDFLCFCISILGILTII